MSVRTQIALALWIMVGVAALIVFQALPAKVTDYQDFRYYYGGSLALRRGINPYGADFETIFAQIGAPVGSASAWERAEIQLDTPAWLIFFEPFTLLQPRAAYWTWTAFNLLALGAALFGIIGELGPPGAEGWTVAALMLLYPPIAINFWLAQSEIVLLAIFVLALAALRRGNHGRAGVMLAAAALLRAYPLGMLGYLVARRNWRASGSFLAACVIGCALAVAFAGFEPVASFAGLAATTSATHARGVPAGLLRHPANLNLGAFVQLVLGERTGASVAALAVELLAAGSAFAATAALEDDRYGFGFALWLAVITMLSPVAWPQFLVCLVPLYVGIAAAARQAASEQRRLPRHVLNLAGASYAAALFMGGPLGFVGRAVARSISGRLHVSYILPAEAAFISLLCAYFAALYATRCATHRAMSREPRPQTDDVPIQPAAKEAAAISLRARLELKRDL